VSSAEGRASVMDYPHPLIRTAPDGSLDLSDAYAVGVGEWDQVAIDYGYRDFPEGTDVPAALGRILAGARDRGLTFLTDQDARPGGSAHPQAHLWDNGRDAAEELTRTMQVRRRALERFGEAAIRNGAPLATLEEALVPLYLHHRYQVEAAAKMVAGVSYTYVLRGDGQVPLALVKGADQGRALDALLSTLAPVELALPRSVLRSLPPRPATYPLHRELFPRWTGLVFDPLSPVQVAADLTISILLEPERCARLVAQAALDPSLPSLADVLARLVGATFDARPADPYEQEVGRVAQGVVVDRLRRLAVESPMLQVRARSEEALAALAVRLRGEPGTDGAERAHRSYLAREIDRFLERAATVPPPPGPLAPPPGSPIGLPPAGGLAGTEPACSQD
ncbi:MAG TPA: zinc-dependent metalloprotease, partial [Vicinamibacteria bacterium]